MTVSRWAVPIAVLALMSGHAGYCDTIAIPGNYETTVSGNHLEYHFRTDSAGAFSFETLLGNPAVLTAPEVVAYSGYAALIPQGHQINSARINVNVDLSAPLPNVTAAQTISGPPAPFFTPAFSGTILSMVITVRSGLEVYQSSATSFSVDLFAEGFGDALQAGEPVIISFNITDRLTADYSAYQTNIANANAFQILTVLDNRNIILWGDNSLDLDTAVIPELRPAVLIAAGLMLIIGLRRCRSGELKIR